MTSQWFKEQKPNWLQRFCTNIIKQGPLPEHVAFIMDGNRRYAAKHGMQKIAGHRMGFERLSDTLQWCRDLGITQVTVYAFSIENFKRSDEEVQGLMTLARNKFEQLLKEKDKLMELGVCIRVIGNVSLLPEDIQKMIAEAQLISKDNTNAVLNVAFSYTSREELSRAAEEVCGGVERGELRTTDVTQRLLEQCLDTNKSPDPHLLVRTSGEVRLSDFLLWQSAFTCIYYTKVLWPEFSFWHLLGAVLYYQTQYYGLKKAKDAYLSSIRSEEEQELEARVGTEVERIKREQEERSSRFIEAINERRTQWMYNKCQLTVS